MGLKLMNYKLHFTVHGYAEEKLDDNLFQPIIKNYGILGEEIIKPLRGINGKEIYLEDLNPGFSIRELWEYIDDMLYGEQSKSDIRNIVEKYLVFNNLRYTIEDVDKPLHYYLCRMDRPLNEIVNIQLLVCFDEGDVLRDDGIRYYMNSREYGEHNLPHVHVDVRHEASGSFSLYDGEQLSGNISKGKDLRTIKETIKGHVLEWLKYWNEHTDGLTVDLNQALNLIRY